MRWLIRFADRTHALALPGAWVLFSLSYYALVVVLTPEETCCWDNRTQLWGTILFYCLLPGVLLAGVVMLWRGNQAALHDLEPVIGAQAVSLTEFWVPSWQAVAAAAIGLLFALSQFGEMVFGPDPVVNPWLDLSLVAGNAVIWMSVGWFSVERGTAALAFRRLGALARVDLYDPDSLKPFATLAIREVLLIMAVLALMPVQSLDAEFRWDNYAYGLAFGLPMAATVFYLYLSGIHRSMVEAKHVRLDELQRAIEVVERSDVARLEALVAHRDRIRHLSAWPLDVSLLSRVLFYLVIPPAAWVGAALVETLVQSFID